MRASAAKRGLAGARQHRGSFSASGHANDDCNPSAQHVHIAGDLIEVEVTRNRSGHRRWCTTAGEPAGAAVALRAGRSLKALDSLRSGIPLQALDRTAVHPGAAAAVPHLERVIRLNDVGIALAGRAGKIRQGRHVALEGDAQARGALDTLLPLWSLRSCRSLGAGRSLLALRASHPVGAGQALHPLKPLRALFTLWAPQ